MNTFQGLSDGFIFQEFGKILNKFKKSRRVADVLVKANLPFNYAGDNNSLLVQTLLNQIYANPEVLHGRTYTSNGRAYPSTELIKFLCD